MTEKLYPLQLPPGIRRTGTVYQSRDRWYHADLVRFSNGTIQPVGGWVKRTLTGAAISGTPSAAVSWQTNTGACFLAIGTTLGLYAVSSTNVVYDLSPVGLAADIASGTGRWQLQTFGAYLVAVYEQTVVGGFNNVLVWTGDTATQATRAFAVNQGPAGVFGLVVTPERFLVALRGLPPSGAGLPPILID